jgi:putative ABC transport system substrate-binding protein
MHRREFITLIGGAAATWPLAASAQQVKTWRIGFLSPADGPGPNHQAFVQQLKKLGYEEGINLRIEWRWLHQQYADLPQMAADLTRQNLDVLVAQTQAVALAAKKATQTVPIIFVGVRDPVAAGLVESMNRPGGNVTGVTLTPNAELVTKQIEILAEMLPNLHQMAVLWNPDVAVQAQVIEVLKNLSQASGQLG